MLALPAPVPGDPNREAMIDAHERATDFGVDVVLIPSVGAIRQDGELVAASHMNFYVANAVVVVPTYGAPSDDAAVAALAALFPGRSCVGLRADHLLTGGGSFHCITQQQPA